MTETVPLPHAACVAADLTLPALRGLSALADSKPVIVIDAREQDPLSFERLASIRGSLYSGDYSISGLEDSFAIERKSLDDLANCCLASQRERFEHELHRLRGYRFKRLLIVGTRKDIAGGRYHSKIAPKAVASTLGAFEVRYSIPVIHVPTPEAAALEVERWPWYFAREIVKNTNGLLQGCQTNQSLSLEALEN